MDPAFYHDLAARGIAGSGADADTALRVLTGPDINILPLLDAAYQIRRHYHANVVTVHILNNAQNGHCPEDCGYCAQAKTSDSDIAEYPLKPEDEILEEARLAHQSGAFRYCMVYAGRGPSDRRVDQLAGIVRKIKERYPLQICVSPGLIDADQAQQLAEAGVDRLNHNLNSSERFYPEICSTHTYADRLNTLNAARQAGLEVCSGIIVGMGESPEDVVDVAAKLAELKAPSIPVNFLVPIEGNRIDTPVGLTPEYCLRVLCMFRFMNPSAEIRAAAGREGHLRSMEVMALYAANSLFLEGYLNTRGNDRARTLQMIRDAGFEIASDVPLDSLLERERIRGGFQLDDAASGVMKSLDELRPASGEPVS